MGVLGARDFGENMLRLSGEKAWRNRSVELPKDSFERSKFPRLNAGIFLVCATGDMDNSRSKGMISWSAPLPSGDI